MISKKLPERGKSLKSRNSKIPEFVFVQLESFHQFLARNFAVDETGWDGGSSKNLVTLFEVIKQHTGWETFTADTDTFKHTITTELMKTELTVNFSGGFVFVGDDTTDEMRRRGHQGVHQILQGFLVTE